MKIAKIIMIILAALIVFSSCQKNGNEEESSTTTQNSSSEESSTPIEQTSSSSTSSYEDDHLAYLPQKDTPEIKNAKKWIVKYVSENEKQLSVLKDACKKHGIGFLIYIHPTLFDEEENLLPQDIIDFFLLFKADVTKHFGEGYEAGIEFKNIGKNEYELVLSVLRDSLMFERMVLLAYCTATDYNAYNAEKRKYIRINNDWVYYCNEFF
jgi:hypothetical protein